MLEANPVGDLPPFDYLHFKILNGRRRSYGEQNCPELLERYGDGINVDMTFLDRARKGIGLGTNDVDADVREIWYGPTARDAK